MSGQQVKPSDRDGSQVLHGFLTVSVSLAVTLSSWVRKGDPVARSGCCGHHEGELTRSPGLFQPSTLPTLLLLSILSQQVAMSR